MHVMSPFYPQACFFLRISPQTPPLPVLHTDRLLTATAWYQVKATAPHQLKTGHALLLLYPTPFTIISTACLTLLCLQESH